MALASLEESPVALTWVIDEPMERASHALLDDGRVWLIDPTDEQQAVERALALGEPAGVLQLLDRHGRDCAALASRLGVVHERVPKALPGTPFEVVPVVGNRLWNEVALWWPAQSALIVAEAIGTAGLFAPGPAGAGVHIGLRLLPPRRLGGYAPKHLLVGHGPAIDGPRANDALHQALERSRRDLPHAALSMLKAVTASARR